MKNQVAVMINSLPARLERELGISNLHVNCIKKKKNNVQPMIGQEEQLRANCKS